MAKKKQSLTTKFGKLSQGKKLLLFLLAFAVIGGGYMAYSSYAEVSDSGCARQGTVYVDVSYTSQANRPTNVAASFSKGYFETLAKGSKGACVAKFQRTVNRIWGEKILAVDGTFDAKDSEVASMIQNWLQKDNSGVDVSGKVEPKKPERGLPPKYNAEIKVNGKVDPLTWGILEKADDLKYFVRGILGNAK